ncbi:unnamed protein product [Pedinophyceae sp. YPF-701]|nr:unnamed protein product [Pedinophyceae sp. YPF-701]
MQEQGGEQGIQITLERGQDGRLRISGHEVNRLDEFDDAGKRPSGSDVTREHGGDTAPSGDMPGAEKPAEKSAYGSVKERINALGPFAIISLAYLLFTVTDGAIRTIVLLHAYNKDFSAMEVALMFTLYETAGVATNLLAGVCGSRWGIKTTLLTGLLLQLGGLGMLAGWQDSWSKGEAIVYVLFAQMLSGVAKDLTKLGGKTVTKLVTPEEKQARLFKLVSFITGFKNSLKGLGYFLGAAFLMWDYFAALAFNAVLILLALPFAALGLSNKLGRARSKSLTLTEIFRKNRNVNILSVARFFLFGSRDLWFEVPLPFFLRDDVFGLGWNRAAVGAFLACWIIGYGQVQSWSPQLLLKPLRQYPANKWTATLWAAVLVACPFAMGAIVQFSDVFRDQDQGGMVAVMVVGLAAFAVVFAVNSSVHSYLIVKYSDGDKVAMNVGFYYMANAMGRLVGTIASGALYSYVGDTREGFAACFWASVGFVVLASVLCVPIADDRGGLQCGPCLTCVGHAEGDPEQGGAENGGGEEAPAQQAMAKV